MLPNRATAVEMSRTSQHVTSPIFPHYHHHHLPPPPLLRAATTAAVEPPSDCPLLGQSGASSSIPLAPNDAMSWPPNAPNNAPHRCHVTGSRRRQKSHEQRHVTPSRRLPTPARHPPTDATSPAPNNPNDPNDAPQQRHVTGSRWPQRRHVTESNDV